jgi:hypothetical protein
MPTLNTPLSDVYIFTSESMHAPFISLKHFQSFLTTQYAHETSHCPSFFRRSLPRSIYPSYGDPPKWHIFGYIRPVLPTRHLPRHPVCATSFRKQSSKEAYVTQRYLVRCTTGYRLWVCLSPVSVLPFSSYKCEGTRLPFSPVPHLISARTVLL